MSKSSPRRPDSLTQSARQFDERADAHGLMEDTARRHLRHIEACRWVALLGQRRGSPRRWMRGRPAKRLSQPGSGVNGGDWS